MFRGFMKSALCFHRDKLRRGDEISVLARVRGATKLMQVQEVAIVR